MDGNENRNEAAGENALNPLVECFDVSDIFDFDIFDFERIVVLAAVAALLFGLGIFLYGLVVATYQLILDPDSVDVAARLDSLSINPDRCLPCS